MLVAAAFGAGHGGMSVLFALAIPVIYVVFGFIFSVIAAWVYNVVAKWTGGIEFESEEQA